MVKGKLIGNGARYYWTELGWESKEDPDLCPLLDTMTEITDKSFIVPGELEQFLHSLVESLSLDSYKVGTNPEDTLVH